ncbi:MAG: RdgB/HAM1 family non-canonical purine NTP pyrophosphatase [Oscillospiraceae bacterium]|nr:RdgB/HAM1 family non-canonical purine NTP pyrophosphatase [Oscillospiraceae bacterium]
MKKIKMVFASGNAGKIREMDSLVKKNLSGIEIQLLGLKDIGFTDEIIENGATFEENAEIKARAVYEKAGMICFAEDSGLCVDYLNGAPGIYSARYGGGSRGLLDELKNVSEFLRTAHFYCAIYCVTGKNTGFCVSGSCSGMIAREMAGDNGFGYDPVFYYPPAKKTFAQLSEEEKNNVSHRAKAAEKFAETVGKYIEND